MRKMALTLAIMTLGACSGGNLVPGESEGKCDKNPESCMSVREATSTIIDAFDEATHCEVAVSRCHVYNIRDVQ